MSYLIIQLGSHTTKYGLKEDILPSKLRSVYFDKLSRKEVRCTNNVNGFFQKLESMIDKELDYDPENNPKSSKDYSTVEQDKDEISALETTKSDNDSAADPEATSTLADNSESEESNSSDQSSSNSKQINLPIDELLELETPSAKRFYFGAEAIKVANFLNKEYFPLFPFGLLEFSEDSSFLKSLYASFFKALIDSALISRSEEAADLFVLVTLPSHLGQAELLFLTQVFIEEVGVKGVTFQLEHVAALYALKISSVCIVDFGYDKTEIVCLRDGFEIYKSRVLIPCGNRLQDVVCSRFLSEIESEKTGLGSDEGGKDSAGDFSEANSESRPSLVSEGQFSSPSTNGALDKNPDKENPLWFKNKTSFLRKTLIGEYLKENIGHKTNEFLIEAFDSNKSQKSFQKIYVPDMKAFLPNLYCKKNFLKHWTDLSASIFERDRLKSSWRWKNCLHHNKPPHEIKLEIEKVEVPEKIKGKISLRRKRYTVDQMFNEGKKTNFSFIEIDNVEDGILKSICSLNDYKEIAFYTQQIVLIGGGSKLKRLGFLIEKALWRKFRALYDLLDPQILKVLPNDESELLPWYGMKNFLLVQNPLQYFVLKGKDISISYLKETLLMDVAYMGIYTEGKFSS